VTAARGEPRIEAYIGASGSGKGVSIARRLKELQPKRLIIWDPRAEYDQHAERVEALPELVRRVSKAGADKGFRLRYVPGPSVKLSDAFGLVCTLAFRAGDAVFVAEELSDVTSASLAPPAWRQCVTQGRHQALHLIAAAQRPALIDKTILGNCTYIRCFTLRYREDRAAMAKAMDVDETRITELVTTHTEGTTTIRYLERDFRAQHLRGGTIKLHR
jgi:hypothetical protein